MDIKIVVLLVFIFVIYIVNVKLVEEYGKFFCIK